MDQQKLTELRTKILHEVVPLVETADIAPEQKFALLINAARLSQDASQYEKAYQAALEVTDASQKVELLLDLLEEVDVSLGEADFAAADEQPAAQPQENSKPAEA